MSAKVDPRILGLAKEFIAKGKNKRAIAVLKQMLAKGSVTTDDLAKLGYNHPPRAVGDVRDAGIPVVTSSTVSPTGKRIAVYTFGDPADIQEGRFGGRSAFPKAFKEKLIAHYGSQDRITGATLDPRVLQIDHRIPYRISGDEAELDVRDFMLLDGSSQRAKSWSCEHCPNMARRAPEVCRTCFWAFPENYSHIATEAIRRVDVSWQGDDVVVFDRLKAQADKEGKPVAELIREWARQRHKAS